MTRKVLSVLFFTGFVSMASGQWTIDPTLNTPVCTTSDRQSNVQIVADGFGGAVILWQGGPAALPDISDIYAQRLDSAGYGLWQPQGVIINSANARQEQLNAAPDGAGGAAAVWRENRRGLVSQHILPGGTEHWGSQGVLLTANPYVLAFPKIIRNRAGGFITAWAESRNSIQNIYAQFVDTAGLVQWSGGGIPLKQTPVTQWQQIAIPRDSAGAIVVWMESLNQSTYPIVAQAINPDGSLPWGNSGRVVCNIAGADASPRIVSDGHNGAIIAWVDNRPGSAGAEIYAQRIDNMGNALWQADGNIICGAAGDQSNVVIESDSMGGAIILWEDTRPAAPGIYAQRINASGTLKWQTNGVPVCTQAGASPSDPRIAPDANGGVFVVWEDWRQSTAPDIYMQRIGSNGAQQWLQNGIPVSIPMQEQTSPRIIPDGFGNAIVAWEDGRNNNSDVFAAKTSADGLIPVELALFEAGYADGSVYLHWFTATETNSHAFHIERSFEGHGWTEIGTAPARGFSSTPVDYYFTDSGPFNGAAARYRLRQVDTDGSYRYSPVVFVSVIDADAFAIHALYPQPASDVVRLGFTTSLVGRVRIAVYNALGQLVLNVPAVSVYQPGYHDVSISTAALPAGTYLVAVAGPQGTRTTQLIVSR